VAGCEGEAVGGGFGGDGDDVEGAGWGEVGEGFGGVWGGERVRAEGERGMGGSGEQTDEGIR